MGGILLAQVGKATSWPADSTEPTRPNYRQLHGLFAVQTVLYTGTLYGLSKSWYKNPATRFSVADDAHEWKQLDKLGHLYTAYQISLLTAELYKLTGISKKQAIFYGALSGFFFMTPIEILDGFAPDYGFSPSDMVANVLGPTLFMGQYALWDEIRIHPKFSFHHTPLAAERPELLGSSWSERWLKDYNGQTYWFSASPRSFAPGSKWPGWLCFSLGYGIHDMVAAEVGKSTELGFVPYRQYYLSLDVDFTKIKSRRKFVRTLGLLLNTLKVPAPALEVSKHGLRFRPLYF
ncbi:hypothetical protein HNQ92_002098 [Rhabdobacter roseus]|uniref:DUF2279 domain-containing protein n=1 Tax=Rhabdobacter roseus TaxID=1655419 RepID=A0A840TM06_9BACT|nr:DUF2279 domain-containing protein [Rhabdobacter roseus]MBB5283955.1 hypothetical protein [Rhabdobacter roseus]